MTCTNPFLLCFLALALSTLTRLSGDDIDPQSGKAVPDVAALAGGGYTLAWSDEFNGTTLDTDKWVYRTDKKSWSKQQAANVDLADGLLRIHVRQTVACDATSFPIADNNIWLTCIGYNSGRHKKMDDSKLPSAAEFDYFRFLAPAAGN